MESVSRSEDPEAPVYPRRPHILLCASGSVAAVKIPELYNILSSHFDVRIVLTQAASNFSVATRAYAEEIYREFEEKDARIYRDEDEWQKYEDVRKSQVLHIELRKWADLMLIAPLSANTLAKLALGLCDNLLTSIARAWDMEKPLLLAPAMNTMMWNHPATAEHLALVKKRGALIIEPVSKLLACKDTGKQKDRRGKIAPLYPAFGPDSSGKGALAPVGFIVDEVHKALRPKDRPVRRGGGNRVRLFSPFWLLLPALAVGLMVVASRRQQQREVKRRWTRRIVLQ